MNKQEFMKELGLLLADIPEVERKEALAYYEDYFLDAGEENELSIIRELESPLKVAQTIKEGLGYTSKETTSYESAAFGYSEPSKGILADSIPTSEERGFSSGTTRKPLSAGLIVLLIFASPFLLGVAGVVLGLFMGVLGTLIGCIAAAFGISVAFIVVAVILVFFGFSTLFASPAASLILIGLGLMFLAISITGWLIFGWLISTAIPGLFRGFVALVRGVLGLNRKEAR